MCFRKSKGFITYKNSSCIITRDDMSSLQILCGTFFFKSLFYGFVSYSEFITEVGWENKSDKFHVVR